MNFAKRRISSAISSRSESLDSSNSPTSAATPPSVSPTVSSGGKTYDLDKIRSSNSNNSQPMSPEERRRSSLLKPNFHPEEIGEIRAHFHNSQSSSNTGVFSFITPLAAESSIGVGGHTSSRAPFQYHGKHEEAMQKFRFSDKDLSALLSDEKSFLALQLSLRRKGAVTNALLLQGLPFFIMKNRKILLERMERDERRRQEAAEKEEQRRLEEEAKRLREEAGIFDSEEDVSRLHDENVDLEGSMVWRREKPTKTAPKTKPKASLDLGDFDDLEARWTKRNASRSVAN